MTHPSPSALMEWHFEESSGAEREAVGAHVQQCRACGEWVAEVRALESALASGPDDGPPEDGLDRVLARVAAVEPARARRAEWVRAAVPSAAALAGGAWAVRFAAERLTTLGLVPASFAGHLAGDLLSLSLAAVGVAAAGAIFTLALAPVLILESHGRPSWQPRRS